MAAAFRFGAVTPVLAVTLVAVGCNPDNEPAGPDHTGGGMVNRPSTRVLRTIDDEFADLADQAPGFGGMYYDENGGLVVVLTDPTKRAEATASLERARQKWSGDQAQVLQRIASARVVKGDFDFRRLKDWYGATRAAFADGAVTMTDIDEVRNRIVIGVADAGSLDRVRQMVARMPIPASAVLVEVRLRAQTVATVRDRIRPVPGGVQIRTPTGFGGYKECTLGWNAYRRDINGVNGYDGKRYFVTNSHCSLYQFSNDAGQIGQNDINNIIGVEVVDPLPFTNAENGACPVDKNCRYSDAMLGRYNDGVAWNHGRIPRLGTGFWKLFILGYNNIGGEAGEYDLLVGYTASKTGRTTGTTSGAITASCVDVLQDTGFFLLCQMQANISAQGGDSGSPVYVPLPDGLHLVGILWGTGSPGTIFFSRWYLLNHELSDADDPNAFAWYDTRYGACPQCGY